MRFFSLFLLLIVCATRLVGQSLDEIEDLEKKIDKVYGLERLNLLNQLTHRLHNLQDKKALKYARQAESLCESIFSDDNVLLNQKSERLEKYQAHFQLGLIYFQQEKYQRARVCFKKASTEAELIDDVDREAQTHDYLHQIDSLASGNSFFARKLDGLNVSDAINSSSTNLKISTHLKMAAKYEKNEKYARAIEQYEKAMNLSLNRGEAKNIATIKAKIAELYKKEGKPEAAIAYYQMASDDFEKLGDTVAIKESQMQLEGIFTDVKRLVKTDTAFNEQPKDEANTNNVLPLQREDDVIEKTTETINRYKQLSEESERKGDYDQSVKYIKQYAALQAQLVEEQKQQEIDSINLRSQAQKIQLLQQQNDLNAVQASLQEEQLQQQARSRNILAIGSLLLLILATIFYLQFVSKRKAHNRLKVTFDQLDATKANLEVAEKNITKLLAQQVSPEIAQALISENAAQGTIKKFVCVMFLDIRNFTPFANVRTPEEIIQYQNDVFGFMIEIINQHHGVINQFMGDGFMATFGVPFSKGNDIQNAFSSASKIVEEVNRLSKEGQIYPTRVGIGLHAGSVVAGNVGTELRKQYSITGTTVITAARIEQLNKQYSSQFLISGSVMEHLENSSTPQQEITTQLKGMDEEITLYKIA